MTAAFEPPEKDASLEASLATHTWLSWARPESSSNEEAKRVQPLRRLQVDLILERRTDAVVVHGLLWEIISSLPFWTGSGDELGDQRL